MRRGFREIREIKEVRVNERPIDQNNENNDRSFLSEYLEKYFEKLHKENSTTEEGKPL